jgi:glucose-6-phosphate-specific signal transduction histidine kinase
VQPQTLTSPYAFAFLGAFTYVVGGSLVRWAADRGFASTERALAGAEQAVAARHLALERWRVGRAEERRLHDTVLATLTLLAHGGDGLDDADLRRYCARDVDVLAGRGEVAPTRVPVQAGPASADGVPARDLLETLVLDAASLRVVLRVHVASESAEVRIDGTVARALHDVALEGIRNVRRHAHVDTADLTLLTTADDVSLVLSDEGAGFDSDADRGQGLGLRAAAERMLDVGGRLTVWSRRVAGASLVVMAPTRRPPAVVGRREELRE